MAVGWEVLESCAPHRVKAGCRLLFAGCWMLTQPPASQLQCMLVNECSSPSHALWIASLRRHTPPAFVAVLMLQASNTADAWHMQRPAETQPTQPPPATTCLL